MYMNTAAASVVRAKINFSALGLVLMASCQPTRCQPNRQRTARTAKGNRHGYPGLLQVLDLYKLTHL
jgi:hypothetical protein